MREGGEEGRRETSVPELVTFIAEAALGGVMAFFFNWENARACW